MSSELEKHKFVIHFVSLVSYQFQKVEGKEWLCMLTPKELLDLKDLYQSLKDLVWMNSKCLIMWLMQEHITLINKISYCNKLVHL